MAGITAGVLHRDNGGQHVSTAGTPAPPPSGPSSSADTATTATTSPASGVALQRVDWSRAAALDCGSTDQGPVATTVVQVAYPSPAPDKTVAVVLVRCDAGAGTPPTSVLVFDQATSTTAAHLLGR
jgi:hypothetical protein